VPFGVYCMTADGQRELLAFDWTNSCSQAIPVAPRKRPVVGASLVDWNQANGRFYIHNVYLGPGLKDVPRGTIKRLRVVALEFRAAKVSENFNDGTAGDSLVQTPVSIGNGSQDVKHVLGEVDVEEDGSVYFEVPARNAVYFQLLDQQGRCVQTMRSWTMVMPGEQASCVGCHEDKQSVPTTQTKVGIALTRPAQKLQPLAGRPHPLLAQLKKAGLIEEANSLLGVNQPRSLDASGPADGFSYIQRVQPIWDKHCVGCHEGNANDPDAKKRSALRLTGEVAKVPASREVVGRKNFTESYLALTAKGHCTPLVNWVHPVARSAMLPPYTCGSPRSKLMDYLETSHYNVQLTDAEKRTVACWIDLAVPFCGSYAEANAWSPQEKAAYEYFQKKRLWFAQQELENIKSLGKK